MTHLDIQESLGVFALDAVDENERRIIEAHIIVCGECRDEVAEHREVVSKLAATERWAPPGLWDGIATQLTPPVAELRQNIDVSAYASQIDAGAQRFDFSGYVRSYSQVPTDESTIKIEYYDAQWLNMLGQFDSGPILPGGTYERTFDEQGTFQLGCAAHAWMTMEITVEPAQQESTLPNLKTGMNFGVIVPGLQKR